MLNLLFIIAELSLLAVLSGQITNSLFSFFHRLTRSRSVSVTLVTVILFPGTVIHELAHLFTAEILGVKTGKLTLAPESIREPEIQAGSIMVAGTDPWRRTIIGLSLLFWGIMTIFIINLVNPLIANGIISSAASPGDSLNSQQFDSDNWKYIIVQTLSIYLIFAVSSTMWPSKTDLKDVWGPIIITGLVIASAFLIGFRLNLTGSVLTWVNQFTSSLIAQLGWVLVLDVAIWLMLTLMKNLTRHRPHFFRS